MKLNANLFALVAIIVSGLFYYQVVFSTPIVFGDEGHYASVGRWISENGIFPKYQPYWGTDLIKYPVAKPPLYYLFDTFAWILLGEMGIKLLIPLFSMLSAAMIYMFFKRIGNPKAGLAGAFALMMLPGLITYGVMNYVEASLVLLFTCAAYFGYFGLKENKLKYIILAGIFSAFSLMTDITGVFLGPLFLLYFLLSKRFLKIAEWKNLIVILAVTLVVVMPWFLRNYSLYNGFCYPFLPGKCEPVMDVEILGSSIETGVGPVPEVGTGASIAKMGFMQYARFAFGWSIAALLVFGIANFFWKRSGINLFFAVWLGFFLLLTLQQAFFGGRAEDVPRYTLFGFPAVAAVSGLFVSSAYDFLKRFGKYIAIIFVLFFLAAAFVYGSEKLSTMQQVKHGLDGLVDGCKWVKVNTPKDSLVYGIYAHQEAYQCNRKVQSEVPDKNDIRLGTGDTPYEHLKLHGYDYVFIEQFTVSVVPYGEATPLQFLNYLETSQNFRKVFDNTGIYGQAGVRIYQILYDTSSV